MGFINKDSIEQSNLNGAVYVIIIVLLFMLGHALIESGKWVNFIIFLGIGSILLYGLKVIEKKKKETPISLGKKFGYKYPVVTQYAPPENLNPAEAGLLYNCKVDVTDLTSLIYQRAYEGLIDIKNVNGKNGGRTLNKIQLTKLHDIDITRPFFEVEIFNSIFCVGPVKIIGDSSQLRYVLLLEDLEFHGIKKGWMYRKTGNKLLKIIYVICLLLMYISLYWLITSIAELNGRSFLSIPTFIILLLLCIFLGGYIDGGTGLKLTDKGAKLAAYVIGYRNFIKGCDENMIKAYLKQDPLFIDKTIPYATAFGLETEFINKVSPLVHDLKAKYVNGQKVTIGMKVLAFLLHPANKSKYDIFYRW